MKRVRSSRERESLVPVFEALFGVLLIAIIGASLPQHWGLLDIQPHPLWIVVLAMSVRYGGRIGYLTAAFASFAYILFLSVNPTLQFHLPQAHTLVQPLLFLVVGGAVAEFSRARLRHLAETRAQLGVVTSTADAMKTEQQMLAEQNAELSKHLEHQTEFELNVYEMAKRLTVLHTQSVIPAILDLVKYAFAADECAIYLLRGGRLVRQAWSHGEEKTLPVVWNTQLVGCISEAFAIGHVVTVRDLLSTGHSRDLAHDPAVLAGPLKNQHGLAVGVVAVASLPFTRLNAQSTRLLGGILEWASLALANAEASSITQPRLPALRPAKADVETPRPAPAAPSLVDSAEATPEEVHVSDYDISLESAKR